MPTAQEHIQRAKQNLRFAESLDFRTTPYLDWIVTAYFYAALHLVDALLWEKEKINPGLHKYRRGYVKDKVYLREISTPYRSLQDRSEDARYRLTTITRAQIEDKVIPLYKAIESHILPQLEHK